VRNRSRFGSYTPGVWVCAVAAFGGGEGVLWRMVCWALGVGVLKGVFQEEMRKSEELFLGGFEAMMGRVIVRRVDDWTCRLRGV
jgi:hypothetical protein